MSATAAVRDLTEAITWLTQSLTPGTSKPYRAPEMSADKRAERDRELRLEQHAHDWTDPPLGESPAPLDLDVADLLSEILTAADDLADLVSDAANVDRLPTATSAWADPTPYLQRVIELVNRTGVGPVVQARCERLTERAHRILGLIGDGQLLAAICFSCGGRTVHYPNGGQKTLRVRAVLPKETRDVRYARWYVTCEGGLCEPTSAECGTWIHGRPAWDLRTEDKFLADKLAKAAA